MTPLAPAELARPRGGLVRARLPTLARGALLTLLFGIVGTSVAVTLVLAYFSSTRGTAATFSSMQIFSGTRSTAAFSVTDASSGTAVDASNPYAFDDSRTATTSAWATAFDTGRYLDIDLNGPLPSELAVSGATFHLRFASSAAGDTTCYYADVRTASTGALLATYGSSGSPVGCVTGTTASTVSVAIGAVSTSGRANDLRVRIYGRNSGSGSMVIERATVSGATPQISFTLYPIAVSDAADGSPAPWIWALSNP